MMKLTSGLSIGFVAIVLGVIAINKVNLGYGEEGGKGECAHQIIDAKVGMEIEVDCLRQFWEDIDDKWEVE